MENEAKGKLSVVGIGPGGNTDLTERARRVLAESDVIVGYTLYAKMVQDQFPGKRFISTPMRQEVARCKTAVEEARSCKVAMVCSGDPGVYGMAALCYELAEGDSNLVIEVIPGVTAATAGAALLGAPLTHDFAVISLSDLLTAWEDIELRLRCAAKSGLSICLYNPASHKRPDHLKRAVAILLEEIPGETLCGLAHSIGREGEYSETCTLAKLPEMDVDMFTTVYIGNSRTKLINGKMVTPRGYLQRQD